MTIAQTTPLKNAVHVSVRGAPPKPKTAGEKMISRLVEQGAFPFKVQLPEYAAQPFVAFWRDVQLLWGDSGALGPIEFGTIGSRGVKRSGQPPISTDALMRFNHTRSGFRDHEEYLFCWLVKALTVRGASLTKLGKDLYLAEHDVLARERATVRIQALADTIRQHYPQRTSADSYKFHMERLLQDRAAKWRADKNDVPIAAPD